jgi:hypothetical protein
MKKCRNKPDMTGYNAEFAGHTDMTGDQVIPGFFWHFHLKSSEHDPINLRLNKELLEPAFDKPLQNYLNLSPRICFS